MGVELQGLGSVNLPFKSSGIQPGQRFLIEVIHKDPSGKAQIRISGNIIPALLEISAQPGEKFWATVQRIDEQGMVLVRDKNMNPGKDLPLDPGRIGRLYIEFNQNKENSLSNLLRKILNEVKSESAFSKGKNMAVPSEEKSASVPSEGKSASVPSEGKSASVPSDGKSASVPSDGKSAPVPSEGTGVINNIRISEGKGLLNLQDSSDLAEEIVNLSGKELSGKELIANFIQTTIPQWSNLSQDGFMQLFLLLKGLGLDYERRLKKMETMEGDEIQNLQLELKKTLKGILLSLLEGGDSKENENSLANRLLERITGQQILLQGGSYDTPFYLMEIPLQLEGELYTQTLAIKASRKGKKLDLDHCRLALHAETPSLGELGLEGWLYESQLTLKLFSHSPDQVDPLIQENYSYTRELFRQMGITLNPISVAPLKTAEEFQRFLRGELCEGVDYQV